MRGWGLTLDGMAARIDAVDALRSAAVPRTGASEGLRTAAARLDEASPDIEHVATAVGYAGFAELLRICAEVVDWRRAVLNAAPDADRHLRAAKAKRVLWVEEYAKRSAMVDLVDRSADLAGLDDVGRVASILSCLAAAPLPVGVIKSPHRPRIPGPSPEEEEAEPQKGVEAPTELNVAFVKFALDGSPASEIHYLSPNESHDVEIEVRISRWPEGATELVLRPLTIEQPDSYSFPVFSLPKPSGKAPWSITQRGRALLKYPQSLQARPYEFRYTAQFKPTEAEHVAVVGQRTLRIDSVDLSQNRLTGYPHMDAQIVKLRDDVRSRPLVAQDELANALAVLVPMAKLACRCLQDKPVKEPWSESRFQDELLAELRRDPQIASEVEVHPHAAGGIADLSFRGIRIELKAETNKTLGLADCDRYLPQTATYVVASGKRIGILSVLDSSPKTQAPFAAEDGLGLSIVQTEESPVCIFVLLIQGNLALPSALS